MSATMTIFNWDGASPILPHPGELIASLIVFGVLYYFFASRVVPRLEKIHAERNEAIQGGLEKAERAQAEADRERDKYRLQLAEARDEANTIREQARGQGAAIIAEMRQQAQDEANRITSQAQAQIAAERRAAQTQLRAEIGGLATELASRIVGESLEDSARQSRVVDRFLEELGEPGADREPAGA